jgi:putative membrane protein
MAEDNTISPDPLVGTDPNSPWQALSPVAIVYFTASIFKQLLGNIVYLIPALIFSYKSVLQHPFIWLPAILVIISLMALTACLKFKMYRYRLSQDTIEIRSGIFNKTHLHLPFSRVQNVKLEQPLYYRLTGHACLQLDTAGSAKQEAKIVALPLDFATQLKQSILSQKSATPQASNNDNPDEGEVLLNSRSLSDLVVHGICSNRIWILVGGLAPFYDNIMQSVSIEIEKMGLDLSERFNLDSHSTLEVLFTVLVLGLLIVLVILALSVVGAIVSFYGFTLSKIDDRYIRRSGLLTKYEVSMGISRLQMLIQKQDWLDRLLKRVDLKLQQNSASHTQDAATGANNKIVVPSITQQQSQDLIDELYPQNTLKQVIQHQGFTGISKVFIWRQIILIWLPIYTVTSIAAWSSQQSQWLFVTTAVFLFICGLVVLRWKRWGIATDQHFVYLRKGLIGVDYVCFNLFKVQQTQFMQSILLQKRQLASVRFVLASGAIKVPMLKQSLAYRLLDYSLYKVGVTEKSWM